MTDTSPSLHIPGVLKALEQEIKQVLDGFGDTEKDYPILTALYDNLPYGGGD